MKQSSTITIDGSEGEGGGQKYLTDQLLLPLALAGGGGFRSVGLSPHAQTNIEVIHRFLPIRIKTEVTARGDQCSFLKLIMKALHLLPKCALAAMFILVSHRAHAEEPWVKSPRNPMLSLGAAEAFDSQNMLAPTIAKDGGKYFLFYAGGPSGPRNGGELVRYQLGLALSDDGEKWTKTGQPLLPLGERDNFHVTPALSRNPAGELLKTDGVWHMVFCGNRADDIEHATSRDGLTWEKDPRNPIFKNAYSPNLVQVDGELRMYYISKPKPANGQAVPWEVHLATGKDFQTLKAHPSNPVLTVSQPWEKGALFYPYVLREGEVWLMFYAAYWPLHPGGQGATAIGIARSLDGVQWTKNPANPVLTPTATSAYDSVYTSSQSIIRDGNLWRMYYAGRIDKIHKYFAIGQATRRGQLDWAGGGK